MSLHRVVLVLLRFEGSRMIQVMLLKSLLQVCLIVPVWISLSSYLLHQTSR